MNEEKIMAVIEAVLLRWGTLWSCPSAATCAGNTRRRDTRYDSTDE